MNTGNLNLFLEAYPSVSRTRRNEAENASPGPLPPCLLPSRLPPIFLVKVDFFFDVDSGGGGKNKTRTIQQGKKKIRTVVKQITVVI